MRKIRLGVNIDHVATLKNVRHEPYPSPFEAAKIASENGAEVITFHLREDRRHIKDADVFEICEFFAEKPVITNFEMAATDEMLQIALKAKPDFVCLVPEKREELTTEGGLDVVGNSENLQEKISKFQANGIKVSLFVDANEAQIRESAELGVEAIEIHTGDLTPPSLREIIKMSKFAADLGLQVHAGHGLNLENVAKIAEIPEIEELNIGHFLIARAIFIGLPAAILEMKQLIDEQRK